MPAVGEEDVCAAIAGITSAALTSIATAPRSAERVQVTLWLSARLQPDLRL
jgi:hypothetical protein